MLDTNIITYVVAPIDVTDHDDYLSFGYCATPEVARRCANDFAAKTGRAYGFAPKVRKDVWN
jgi:hypothetical protein